MQYPRGERKFLHVFSYSFSPGKIPFIYKADLGWQLYRGEQKKASQYIRTK